MGDTDLSSEQARTNYLLTNTIRPPSGDRPIPALFNAIGIDTETVSL